MATAQQVTYDRPPEGLSRGRYTVPPWVIIALAAVLVVSCIVFLVLRARAPKAPIDIETTPGKPPPKPIAYEAAASASMAQVPAEPFAFDGAASGPMPQASAERSASDEAAGGPKPSVLDGAASGPKPQAPPEP